MNASIFFPSNDVVVDGDDAFVLGGVYCTGGSADTVQHYDLTQPNNNAVTLPKRLVSGGEKETTKTTKKGPQHLHISAGSYINLRCVVTSLVPGFGKCILCVRQFVMQVMVLTKDGSGNWPAWVRLPGQPLSYNVDNAG